MSDTIDKISKYLTGTSRYPLMVVVSSSEYKEVLGDFSNVTKIKVSDYCVGVDKEPDTEKLLEDIKMKRGNYLLVGLGDYLASKGHAVKSTLSSYKDIVLQDNTHVAVILSAQMYSEAKEIFLSDPRFRTRIILPKSPPNTTAESANTLAYGIKAYLDACEKGEEIGSIKSSLHLKNATVINSESAYEELKHRYPNEFAKLSQDAGTLDNWRELLESISKEKMSIAQYFAAQDFASLEYIFLDYAKRSDYKAWLYFLYLKLNSNKHDYIYLVANKASTQSQLFGAAKLAILEIPVSDKRFKLFYAQRKIMLKGCEDVDMADFIPQIHVRGADRIAYLTDNTRSEKQAVIVSLCEGASSKYLPESYPDLALYLRDYQFKDERITDYFAAYKKCKVLNSLNEELIRDVSEYARSRPYNSLPARSALISGMDDGKTMLLFLDAFGVEYLGYVKEKCANLKLHFASKIARADLPTITSVNRSFFDEWSGLRKIPIKDLDELKHHPERGYDHNNSPYPIHLAEELEVIDTALKRAKTLLHSGEYRKVLIASDHGASRLAVISPDDQISNNGCEAKSSGRYCVGDDLPTGDNIVTECDRDYAVISNYSRFIGSRAASVEIHGGASLEEVIVPLIELTLADKNIQVTLENEVIQVSYKTVPTLILIITPDCDSITALVCGKNYAVEKIETSKYKVELPDLKKGQYMIEVLDNQNKLATKEFTIKSKGFAERDMF